jgi:hypothetical protein
MYKRAYRVVSEIDYLRQPRKHLTPVLMERPIERLLWNPRQLMLVEPAPARDSQGTREIRLSLKQSEHAEADLRESIALAQKMSAKAWELRATMSLARLFAMQGRRNEARTMLTEIYGWFTEGFDTADLKDAKALLDELS